MLDKKDKLIAIIKENPELTYVVDDKSDRIIIAHQYQKLVLRVQLAKSTLTIRTTEHSCYKGVKTLKKFREILAREYAWKGVK